MAEPSSSNSSYDSSGSDDEVSLKDVMRLYTLGEIVPKDTDRLVINESLLLPEALKLMAKNGDHVVPITDGKSIVGTIELTRIVRSIVNSLHEKDLAFDAKAFDVEEWKQAVGEENYQKCTVKEVRMEFMDPEEGGMIYSTSTPLHFAAYTMSSGQHRFPIIGEGGSFHGFWRPSTVAKVLLAHSDDLGDALFTPVSVLKPNLKSVVQISAYDKLIRAFRTNELNYWNCSGIAVLDGSSRLIGNISSPDLRLVIADAPKSFSNLYLTAGEFLKRLDETYPEYRRPLCTAKLSSTFSDVLKLITEHKVFRVYVVDDDGVLVGVVKLADILNFLLPPLITNAQKAAKGALIQ